MKSLVILAIVLFATKKVAGLMLAFVCVLLFGYGSYVVIRDIPTPGLLRRPGLLPRHTPSLMP